MVYRVNYETIQSQRDSFYGSRTEEERKQKDRPPVDMERVAKVWSALIDVQNGDDIDDYIIADNNKIERYFSPVLPPPAKLLFFGTGTGREVLTAQSMGYAAEGTTFGKSNPEFAKHILDLDIKFIDSATTPWPNAMFDGLGAFQVFEHCHSPYIFLAECNRLLRPGGYLVLEWPAMFTVNEEGEVVGDLMYEDNPMNLHHFCCWTPAQAVAMVQKCGFHGAKVFRGVAKENTPPFDRQEITRKDLSYYSNFGDTEMFLVAAKSPENMQPPFIINSR